MARIDVGLLPQQPIEMAATFASAAEHLGFEGLWIADSQSVFRDAFLALGAAAMSTRRITLAPGVTNPKTRHPAVLACLAGTLAEASNGRLIVGIGVGESAVRNIGERPASVRELEEFVLALRGLLDGEEVGWRGNRLRLSWNTPRVPVYVAASGPRMLRLAGRIGDGVLFQVGARPEAVCYALDQIAAGATEAGRDVSQIELCMRLAVVVGEDLVRARDEVRAYAAVAANTLARTIPREVVADVAADLDRLRDGYDYGEHGYLDARHRHLLTDAVIDSVAILGNGREAGERLAKLAALGVDRFVVPVDVDDMHRGLQNLAATLPYVATARTLTPDGEEAL
jgi:5,10-methylenetetrahydromethanopterin reductase